MSFPPFFPPLFWLIGFAAIVIIGKLIYDLVIDVDLNRAELESVKETLDSILSARKPDELKEIARNIEVIKKQIRQIPSLPEIKNPENVDFFLDVLENHTIVKELVKQTQTLSEINSKLVSISDRVKSLESRSSSK